MGAGTCGGIGEGEAAALQGIELFEVKHSLVLLAMTFLALGFSNAQELNVKTVERLFKASSTIDFLDGAWAACNTDSAYFKSDTVLLVQGGANYASFCCEVVRWAFKNGNRFDRIIGHHCQEPPFDSIIFEDQGLKVKFNSGKSGVVVHIMRGKEIVEVFTLIELDRSNAMLPAEYRITMIRIKE